MSEEDATMSETETQNSAGGWVAAIPLPHYGIRKRCDCGRRFWSERGYRGHYALVHILDRAESFRRWNRSETPDA